MDRSIDKESGKIGEYGVDFFNSDDIIAWGQTKFSHDYGKEISRGEIEIFANSWKHLNNLPSGASQEFEKAALELKEKPWIKSVQTAPLPG